MGYKLAIDFGTTNSVTAIYNEETRSGQSIALPGVSICADAQTHLVPTLLSVEDGRTGQVRIGAEVLSQRLEDAFDSRLFRNFKRAIGANKSEARLIDGAPWTEFDAGRAFLQRLIASLPYPIEAIDQLVVTVPVAAFDGYATWLQRAFAGFPPNCLRVVDESTAAALGYSITEPGAMVLVIDFGGGTLDLSLVRMPESREKTGRVLFSGVAGRSAAERGATASVIAKAGVVLGGSDIDQWLLHAVLERAQLSAAQIGGQAARLVAACEQAKVALSSQETVSIRFSTADAREQEVTVTRQELEALMERQGFFQSLRSALDQVMGMAHQKGVYREDIRHVVLVGGTSLIPSVQRTLDAYFRAVTRRSKRLIDLPEWPALTWKVDNTTIRVDKPFTAVVEGALQVSAGLGVDDHLVHGYGLRYRDPQDGAAHFDEVLPMGSQYPTRKPVTLSLNAAYDGQREIALVIAQITVIGQTTVTDQTSAGAVTSVEVQNQGGQAVFLAHADEQSAQITPLNAGAPLVVQLNPPGQAGKERLRAAFRVDEQRALRVTITDLKTRRKLADDALIAHLGNEPDHPAGPAAGGEAPVDTLLPALARPHPGLFRLSLNRLAAMFDELPIEQMNTEVLSAALRSDDCLVRFQAAEVLARRGDREARQVFEEILAHGTPPQRASAAQHMYRFSWFVAGPLFDRALQDSDPRVREAAVFGLCKMHLPEAYRRAQEALQTGNDALRMAAVWGSYSHPDAGAVPVLALAAQSTRQDIRVLAMEVLGATEAEAAIPVVRRAVEDPDPEVIYAATLSWVELARTGCFAELASLIEKTQGAMRRAILRGLFHAANYVGIDTSSAPQADQLLDALATAQADPLPEARLAAAMQLAWMRHPRAQALLLEGFRREPDGKTRATMLANAAGLSAPAAKVMLEEGLSEPEGPVRQAAEYIKSGDWVVKPPQSPNNA